MSYTKKTPEEKICIVCKKPFQTVFPRQKCCNDECSRLHRNASSSRIKKEKYAEKKLKADEKEVNLGKRVNPKFLTRYGNAERPLVQSRGCPLSYEA